MPHDPSRHPAVAPARDEAEDLGREITLLAGRINAATHRLQKLIAEFDDYRGWSCDASVVTVLEDGEGNVLNIGRRARTVPPSIRRALALAGQDLPLSRLLRGAVRRYPPRAAMGGRGVPPWTTW